MKLKFGRTRFYTGLLCFIFILGGAALLLSNTLAIETLEKSITAGKAGGMKISALKPLKEMLELIKKTNLGVSIITTLGFLVSLSMFIGTMRRNISKYMRIIDRLDVKRPGIVALNIQFPDEDEFGGLGSRLNALISHLKTFDSIKTNKLAGANFKIKYLGDKIKEAIAVISQEERIIYTNNSFQEQFQLKEAKEHFMFDAVLQSDKLGKTLEDIFRTRTTKEIEDINIAVENINYRCTISFHPVITQEDIAREVILYFKEVKKTGKVKK